MKKVLAFACIVFFSAFQSSQANIISLSLGEYSSPLHSPGSYNDFYDVGVFNFDLSGQEIISATISGQWGNSACVTTANNKVIGDGIVLANTIDYTPSPTSTPITPWSFNFTNFSNLNDGIFNLSVVQLNEYVIRLGVTTLTITTGSAQVPEPGILYLISAAMVGLFSFSWMRKRENGLDS